MRPPCAIRIHECRLRPSAPPARSPDLVAPRVRLLAILYQAGFVHPQGSNQRSLYSRLFLLSRPCWHSDSAMSLFSNSARCSVTGNATMMVWFRGHPGQGISLVAFVRAVTFGAERCRPGTTNQDTPRSLTDARQRRARVRGPGSDQPRRRCEPQASRHGRAARPCATNTPSNTGASVPGSSSARISGTASLAGVVSAARRSTTPGSGSRTAASGTTASPTPMEWRSSSWASTARRFSRPRGTPRPKTSCMVDNPTFFLRDAVEYGGFSDVLLKARGKEPSSLYNILGFVLSGPVRVAGNRFLAFPFPVAAPHLSSVDQVRRASGSPTRSRPGTGARRRTSSAIRA